MPTRLQLPLIIKKKLLCKIAHFRQSMALMGTLTVSETAWGVRFSGPSSPAKCSLKLPLYWESCVFIRRILQPPLQSELGKWKGMLVLTWGDPLGARFPAVAVPRAGSRVSPPPGSRGPVCRVRSLGQLGPQVRAVSAASGLSQSQLRSCSNRSSGRGVLTAREAAVSEKGKVSWESHVFPARRQGGGGNPLQVIKPPSPPASPAAAGVRLPVSRPACARSGDGTRYRWETTPGARGQAWPAWLANPLSSVPLIKPGESAHHLWGRGFGRRPRCD